MADSKAQKIIDAVVDRLQLINPDDADYVTNGFQTSIGERVEDSRQNWQEDELDAISVFEGKTESTEESDKNAGQRSKTLHLMPVIVKVFVKQRDTSTLTAQFVRKCISDIKRAVRLDDRWKVNDVGLAMLTREKSSGPEYAEEDQYEITGAIVEMEILYITQKFNAEE